MSNSFNIANNTDALPLDRCPHCSVAKPNVKRLSPSLATKDTKGTSHRIWSMFACSFCGGVVTAGWVSNSNQCELYPTPSAFSADLPEEPLDYLKQAAETLHSPRASVVTSAGAVDSMLKARGYVEGSLYSRIEQAVAGHLLTAEMAEWAHDVRLDANDQRHADLRAVPPTVEDAKRCLDFAKALADILFVLPARVTRGTIEAKTTLAQLKEKAS